MPQPTTTGEVLRLLKQRHGERNVVITSIHLEGDVRKTRVSLPTNLPHIALEHWPLAVPYAVFTDAAPVTQPARWLRSPMTGHAWTLHLLTVRMGLEYLGVAVMDVLAGDDPETRPPTLVVVAPSRHMPKTPGISIPPGTLTESVVTLHGAERVIPVIVAARATVTLTRAEADEAEGRPRVRRSDLCPNCDEIRCKHGLYWACGRDEDCAECAHADEGEKGDKR